MRNLEAVSHGVAVTPSDTTDIGFVTRAVWVGGAGNLSVTLESGAKVLLSGITAGSMLPIKALRLWATDTTATLLVALQ